MQIRPAEKDDFSAVAAIWNTMIETTLSTFTTVHKDDSAIASIKNGPGEVFVAEVDGQIAGFACYSQFRNGPGYGRSMEHSIVLDHRFHGQNIGRELMKAIEEDARGKGFHVMVAGVSSANPEGRAFHEAIGYRYVGTMDQVGRKNGQWLNLILLQKIL